MSKNKLHEGIIRLNLYCDSDTSDITSGYYLDGRYAHYVKKHNLKPGDRLQYKIIDGELKIIGKVHVTKKVEKLH